TGTGTWRRRPDTKWKLTPELLATRTAEQAAILEEGARYLKPGGVLVYITCSILPEENDDRIAAFIAAHPEFSSLPPADLWHAAFSAVMPEALETAGDGIALTPLRTATDGFYFNALSRAG
ncbi:MAG TPA: MFS transporter, partial [Devosia sp.]|nr:MFS transporter [Devosia sp.]